MRTTHPIVFGIFLSLGMLPLTSSAENLSAEAQKQVIKKCQDDAIQCMHKNDPDPAPCNFSIQKGGIFHCSDLCPRSSAKVVWAQEVLFPKCVESVKEDAKEKCAAKIGSAVNPARCWPVDRGTHIDCRCPL